VLELMGGGGNILQALQSIASSMSSFIKNSQFQFASQVFGFFGSAASPGGGTGAGASVGDSTVSAASSVAGGSVGDSGSGEINLGTGGFKYLVKNSAGDYIADKFDPYKSYDGETTFTFVRKAGAVQASSPFDRIPDYFTLSISFGVVAGGTVQFSLSRSGRLFVGAGGNIGKSFFPVSPSLTKGWLNQTWDPEPAEVDRFLSGFSNNLSAGFLRWGGGVTATPGSFPNGVERGVYAPQLGYSAAISGELWDTGKPW
jgi:hypothetical protein